MSLLLDKIEKFHETHIVCLGDIMLDIFSYGTVDRISPEAPIPVLHIKQEIETIGGAGNVARNLSSLGANCDAIGIVGTDVAAQKIKDLIEAIKRVDSHLISDPDFETIQKNRFVSNAQQLLRVDRERKNCHLAEHLHQDILRKLEKRLLENSVLILSDYNKGVFTPESLQNIIELAQKKNVPVIVDPKGNDFSIYKGATVLTPNKHELEQAAHQELKTHNDIITFGKKLIKKCALKALLVTLGKEGMLLLTDQKDGVEYLPASAREVFDVSGAGDTVIATFAAALGAGASFQEAMTLANAAGGIVVGKVGTATVHQDELLSKVKENEESCYKSKIVNASQALEKIKAWREQGKTIGFTNGCFDLLHPGHISLISQSKSLCNKLIVALNSDSSIKNIKGEERPIQNETARTTVMASLSDVDLVVLFSEDTPLSLIEEFKPDVLVKGGDYTIDSVVGAKEVNSYGGKVFLADLKEGHGTSLLIEKMKA